MIALNQQGGIGHILPEEARQAFCRTVVEFDSFHRCNRLNDRSPYDVTSRRIDAMTDITLKTQEETFTFDVSDEVLELAGDATRGQTNFTLGSCTGLSECPG